MSSKKIVIISQVYPPDEAAVGQYMEDLAENLVLKGASITVYTSRVGYSDPSRKFAKREVRKGVNVVRLPFSSFGKGTIAIRLLGQTIFLLQCFLHLLLSRKPDSLVLTTSPPMSGAVGYLMYVLRGIPYLWWVMDLNPDQAVAVGTFSSRHPLARCFDCLNHLTLKYASRVVALDKYMAKKLEQKMPIGDRMSVMPLWSMERALNPIPHSDNPFRKENGLEDKFVFMYSGNQSIVHPLDTLFPVILEFQKRSDIVFVFVGGGKGKEALEQFVIKHRPCNVVILPYQPLELIKYSLSAADIHIVSMGDAMVGCVHPCKVYGAMVLAKPFICLGPECSHIGDIIHRSSSGWQVAHGHNEQLSKLIKEILAMPADELKAIGQRGAQYVAEHIPYEVLSNRLSNWILNLSK